MPVERARVVERHDVVRGRGGAFRGVLEAAGVQADALEHLVDGVVGDVDLLRFERDALVAGDFGLGRDFHLEGEGVGLADLDGVFLEVDVGDGHELELGEGGAVAFAEEAVADVLGNLLAVLAADEGLGGVAGTEPVDAAVLDVVVEDLAVLGFDLQLGVLHLEFAAASAQVVENRLHRKILS